MSLGSGAVPAWLFENVCVNCKHLPYYHRKKNTQLKPGKCIWGHKDSYPYGTDELIQCTCKQYVKDTLDIIEKAYNKLDKNKK